MTIGARTIDCWNSKWCGTNWCVLWRWRLIVLLLRYVQIYSIILSAGDVIGGRTLGFTLVLWITFFSFIFFQSKLCKFTPVGDLWFIEQVILYSMLSIRSSSFIWVISLLSWVEGVTHALVHRLCRLYLVECCIWVKEVRIFCPSEIESVMLVGK